MKKLFYMFYQLKQFISEIRRIWAFAGMFYYVPKNKNHNHKGGLCFECQKHKPRNIQKSA